MNNLYLSDFHDGESLDSSVSLLIGSDYYFTFMAGHCIQGVDGPVTLESILGWILSDPVERIRSSCNIEDKVLTMHVMRLGSERIDESLDETLQNFWEIESISDTSESDVMNKFKRDIEFNGERYVTKLPFKECHEL